MGLKRITLYIDDEIEETLDNLGHKENRGQFLREAIKFYIRHKNSLEEIEKDLAVVKQALNGNVTEIKTKDNNQDNSPKKGVSESIMQIVFMII